MKGKGLFLVLCSGSILAGCSGTRPSNLGVIDGGFSPCPDRPNCVSSQSDDEAHAVLPLTYETTAAEAFFDLKMIISRMKLATVIKESPDYLHVEFSSLLFRFVDDVEFFLDDMAKLIHIRSASRVGYSDLGVNRRRVDKIREEWHSR